MVKGCDSRARRARADVVGRCEVAAGEALADEMVGPGDIAAVAGLGGGEGA